MKPTLWIEGLIAAGKSRLTSQLEKALGFRAFPEPVADKGYLELFYADPKRWAFSLQVEMLRRRWEIHRLAMLECRCGNVAGCLLDRGMPGDRVFAWLHYQAGNIHKLEWETYEALYAEFMSIPHLQPTMLVYLDVQPEVALERIQGRARPGEEVIGVGYLTELTGAYHRLLAEIEAGKHPWSNGMQVVKIPWSEHNLPVEPIVATIREALFQRHGPTPGWDRDLESAAKQIRLPL
jgi:deoxyadenosine/deoxycytidine kinase